MGVRVLAACVGAGLLMAVVVPPAAAVDPILGRPIPDEPPVIRLTDLSTASLVVDLDGDGTREVVAVAAQDELRGFAAVQAWWVDAEGVATPSNQVRLRRSATFDDRVAIGNGIRIDEDAMTGVRLGEPAHLFTVRRDGRDVALATGLGQNPELTQACCLTIWEVTSDAPATIDLSLVAELHGWASQVMAADLDGDGTDELVLLEADTSGEAPYSTAVLTWDGSGYRIVRSDVLADTHGPTFLDAGDSDGVPGEDVLLVDMTFDKQEFLTVAQLIRLTLRGDVLVRESSPLEAPQGFAAARLLSTPEGPTILTADGEFFEFVRWPRDASVEPLSLQPGRNGVPLAVMGSGERTLLLVGAQFGEITALHVFSPFRSEWTPVSADLRAGVFASAASGQEPDATPTWTPMGPVPGGFPDSPEAFVFSGMKFVPIPGNGDQFTVDPMAVLPERRIVGTAGPGAGRTVLSSQPSFSVAESPRVVSVGFLADAGTLGLASTASILEPEIESGALKPTFHGVAPNPARPDQLIVGREAVDVEIQAPPGSQLWWTGSGGVEEATVGDDGTARIRLVEAAGESVRDGRRVTRRIWLVTPVGHTYLGSWVISVYRQPPDLGIEDEVPLFDFDPVLVGETLAGSTMTLNGDPVPVAADGSFSVPIDIGVVPTEIRIVVTDPVGNQTERLITRVWPLDYRQLPWVPIVVFVLLMVAGLLYVYEPDSAPRRRVSQDEDSTFEEIGG